MCVFSNAFYIHVLFFSLESLSRSNTALCFTDALPGQLAEEVREQRVKAVDKDGEYRQLNGFLMEESRRRRSDEHRREVDKVGRLE